MSDRPRRDRAVLAMDLLEFRLKVSEHVTRWVAGAEAVPLAEAWQLLPFDKLVEITELACRDQRNGIDLPRDDNGRPVVDFLKDHFFARARAACIDALLRGDLMAEGFARGAPPSAYREQILPERWSALTVDWAISSADGITGIIVRRYIIEPIDEEPSGKRPTPIPEPRLREWVKAKILHHKELDHPLSQKRIWCMAREQIGLAVRKEQVEQIYNELVRQLASEWSLPGRRSKS
jgi:hypothetical protein